MQQANSPQDTGKGTSQPIPFEIRDVSRGVVRPTAVAQALTPDNSVSLAVNMDFDKIIGSAQVRAGTTLINSAVAANKNPLGMAEFVTAGSAANYLVSVYSGASNATLYYNSGSGWSASGLTALSNTAKNRFAILNNRIYIANGTDAFKYSTDGNSFSSVSFTGTTPVTIVPALAMTIKNRMIAGLASATNRSRVYFSSVVDPTANPGITWNTDATTGDWIDINPDDGDDVTAFNQTSGLALIFKRNAMYRLNVISKTVDTDNVFPFGAVSQEATVNCQGLVFFFTGKDIRVTNGGFPNQISRLGVQDFIDAIAQSSWVNVTAGTDGWSVFFNIGTVTVGTGDDKRTFNNVQLKFSVLDQSWAVRSYPAQIGPMAQYTTTTYGRKAVFSDYAGNAQVLDYGTTDNSTAIYYELVTQSLDFSNRSHQNQINDDLAIYMKFGGLARFAWRADERGEFLPIKVTLTRRVNIIRSFKAEGNFFEFKLSGESTQKAPLFEGMRFEKINDSGMLETKT